MRSLIQCSQATRLISWNSVESNGRSAKILDPEKRPGKSLTMVMTEQKARLTEPCNYHTVLICCNNLTENTVKVTCKQ